MANFLRNFDNQMTQFFSNPSPSNYDLVYDDNMQGLMMQKYLSEQQQAQQLLRQLQKQQHEADELRKQEQRALQTQLDREARDAAEWDRQQQIKSQLPTNKQKEVEYFQDSLMQQGMSHNEAFDVAFSTVYGFQPEKKQTTQFAPLDTEGKYWEKRWQPRVELSDKQMRESRTKSDLSKNLAIAAARAGPQGFIKPELVLAERVMEQLGFTEGENLQYADYYDRLLSGVINMRQPGSGPMTDNDLKVLQKQFADMRGTNDGNFLGAAHMELEALYDAGWNDFLTNYEIDAMEGIVDGRVSEAKIREMYDKQFDREYGKSKLAWIENRKKEMMREAGTGQYNVDVELAGPTPQEMTAHEIKQFNRDQWSNFRGLQREITDSQTALQNGISVLRNENEAQFFYLDVLEGKTQPIYWDAEDNTLKFFQLPTGGQ